MKTTDISRGLIRNWKIRTKLMVGFGIVILIFSLGNWFTEMKMERMSKNIIDLYEKPFTVTRALGEANFYIVSMHRSMKDVALAESVQEVNKAVSLVNQNEKKVLQALATIQDHYFGDPAEIGRITDLFNSWRPIREEVIALTLAGKKLDASRITKTIGAEKVKVISQEMGKITEISMNYAEQYKLRAAQENQKTLTTIVLIMLAVLLSAILLSVILSNSISRPIIRLKKVARAISQGNLSYNFEDQSKDEIGDLAISFTELQTSLMEKAHQAREISEGNLDLDVKIQSDQDTMGLAFQNMVKKLGIQILLLRESIDTLASSSSEITASVQQLAASSLENVTMVTETTTTVAEVKQTAEVSRNKAREVAENAVRSGAISKEGLKAVEKTLAGMNRIQQQMEMIAETVVKLSEQSNQIGEITTTVNELAEQSNILAVNAAIEAIKAGELGKGFSVVAQEIKNLAHRSKDATNQVRNILKEVQRYINSAVMATEEGNKAVKEGLKLTEESGKSIKILSESVEKAMHAAIQISASSEQQLEGIEQVLTSIENIKDTSVQTSTSTQQSAQSVKNIMKLGEKLQTIVKQYNIKSI